MFVCNLACMYTCISVYACHQYITSLPRSPRNPSTCMYVHMYVCMIVRMYVVCMYVILHVCMHAFMFMHVTNTSQSLPRSPRNPSKRMRISNSMSMRMRMGMSVRVHVPAAEYLPALQSLHASEPGVLLYLPATHAVHVFKVPVTVRPAKHCTQGGGRGKERGWESGRE